MRRDSKHNGNDSAECIKCFKINFHGTLFFNWHSCKSKSRAENICWKHFSIELKYKKKTKRNRFIFFFIINIYIKILCEYFFIFCLIFSENYKSCSRESCRGAHTNRYVSSHERERERKYLFLFVNLPIIAIFSLIFNIWTKR